MAEKIDPALVKLAQENPRHCFYQKGDPGYVIQWTSTCIDTPARWPVHTETQWTTAMLYPSMAQEYVKLEASSTDCHKKIVGRITDQYGRGKSTVAKARSLFHRSG